MFKSYLFIPANNKRFLESIKRIDSVDYRVFDLEDSILESELGNSIELLSSIRIKNTDWLRIPLFDNKIKQIISISKQIGMDNYVIPKFEGYSELSKIIDSILITNSNAKFILLIENAKSFIELDRILNQYNTCIHGVSLGMHDFTYKTGMINDFTLLRNIRINVMLLAQAYSVEPIDVVSMHLKNERALKDEIIDGFKSGYRAKLFIHPFQLDVLRAVPFYTSEEVIEYSKVLKYYNEKIKGKEALFTYNNRVYEKMHIEKIKGIVEWGDKFYGTDR